MEIMNGFFKIWTDKNDRKIVYSKGNGKAETQDVQKLIEGILECSKDWKISGFAYVAFIENLIQVSAETSQKYIELHEMLSERGCRFIAYMEGSSYEVSVQSDRHKKMSSSEATVDKYFATEAESLLWLKENGF